MNSALVLWSLILLDKSKEQLERLENDIDSVRVSGETIYLVRDIYKELV